jgi:hypothetical protein
VAVRAGGSRRPFGRLREARFTNIDLVLLAGALTVTAVAGAISVVAILGL